MNEQDRKYLSHAMPDVYEYIEELEARIAEAEEEIERLKEDEGYHRLPPAPKRKWSHV